MTDVVTVEQHRVNALLVQHSVDNVGNRAFARAAQSGEPHDCSAMPHQVLAALPIHRMGVPDDLWDFRAHQRVFAERLTA